MELSEEQIKRQDFVDNRIYCLLSDLNPSEESLEWNIEMISDIRERVRLWLVEHYRVADEMTFYPYIG
jgi:septin family protein